MQLQPRLAVPNFRRVFVLLSAIAFAWGFCFIRAAAEDNTAVRVAVGPIMPPLLDRDDHGQLQGFVIDYLSEAARRASMRFEFVFVPDLRALNALGPGEVPLAIWLMSEESLRGYDRFSRRFLTLHSAVFRRNAPGAHREIEATELGEVIVVGGSEAHRDLLDDGALKIFAVPTMDEAVRLLASGQHDTLFGNEMAALDAIKRLHLSSILEAPAPEMHEHQRFALNRSQTRPDLETRLAPILLAMRHDGGFDLPYRKWFGPFEEPAPRSEVFSLTAATAAVAGLVFAFVLFLSRRRLMTILRGQRQALQQTAVREAQLLADIEGIVWEATPDAVFTYVNAYAETLLGYPVADWYKPSFFADVLLHPEDRDETVRLCMAATERGENHVLEYRAITAAGKVVWLHDVVRVVKDESGKPARLHGVMVDITQRKRTEEEAQLGRARVAAIMEASPTGVFRLDLQGRVTFGNKEASRITGIGEGPTDLRRWLNAIHPEDRAAVAEAWKSVITDKLADNREYRFVHPNGDVVWVLDRGVPECDASGRITGFVGTLTDITGRKRAEEAAVMHSHVLAGMSEGVVTTDREGKILYTNSAFEKMFEYAPGELIGKNVAVLSNRGLDETMRKTDTVMASLRETGQWKGEFQSRKKDGSPISIQAFITRVHGSGDAYTVAVQRDITEAKRAEQALRESEERFRRVAESALVGIGIHDETRYTYFNDALHRLLGYRPEDFEGMTWEQEAQMTVAAHDLPRIAEVFARLDSHGSGETEALEDLCLIHRDGSPRWATLFVGRLYPHSAYPRLTVSIDTTDRTRAQQALRESEEKFRRVAESALVGVALFDGTKVTFSNDAMVSITGYTAQELSGLSRADFAKRIMGEDPQDGFFAALVRLDNEQGSVEPARFGDVKLRHRDGTHRWAHITISRLYPEKPYPRLIICIETTERKRTELELRGSEERFRAVAESALVGIAIFDGERYTFSNEAMQRLSPHTLEQFNNWSPAESIEHAYAKEDHERLAKALETITSDPKNFTSLQLNDLRVVQKDGSYRWINALWSPLAPGTGYPFMTIAIDVTERKLAELELKESEERFRALAENALVGVAIYDGDRYTYSNQTMQRLFQRDVEEYNRWSPAERIARTYAKEDIPRVAHALETIVSNPERFTSLAVNDIRVKQKDGSFRWIDSLWSPLVPGKGLPMMVMAMDVTERRLADAARRESEEKFRAVADNAAVGIVVYDKNDVTYLNNEAMRIIGYNQGEVSSLGPEERIAAYIAAEDRKRVAAEISRLDSPAAPAESVALNDVCLRHHDGTPRWVSLAIRPLHPGEAYPRVVLAMDTTERRQRELVLRENEEKFRRVAESALVGIAIHNGTHYTFVNEAMFQIFGQPSELQAQKTNRDFLAAKFFPEADRKRILDAMCRLDGPGGGTEPIVLDDVCFLHSDGTRRWANFTFSRLYAGAPYPRVTTCVETTKLKSAEQVLRDREVMFRRTEQLAHVGGWEINFDSNSGGWSDEVRRIHEVPDDYQPTLESGLAFFSPEDREKVMAMAKRARHEGTPWQFEGQLTTAKGRKIWVQTTGEPILENGRVARVVGAIQDITAMKAVETSLRESEQRLRAIVDSEPECVKLVDKNCLLREMNPAGLTAIEAESIDQVRGLNVLDLIAPEYREFFRCGVAEIFSGKTVLQEFEIIGLKGGRRWMEQHAVPLWDVERPGHVAQMLAVTRDVTARKKAETERHQIEMAMLHAQKLESLGVLTGGIAHDFNNLLAGILGNADLALQDAAPGDPIHESVSQISVAAHRAADLVNQMLAYSGRAEFKIRKLQMGEMVREMAKLLQLTLSKKAVLRYELDDSAPPILADRTQIQQIVMNLITNASDAIGDKPGVITLRSGLEHCTREGLSAYAPNGPSKPGTYVFVEVSDTGCGMDEKTLTKIFDPFFTTKFTGRGLGLAATLGIVRGHHGGLRVTSWAGHGTTFRIIFPAASVEAAPENTPPAVPAASHNGPGTLLVVDDDPRVLDFMVRALQLFGHNVLCAAGGREAIDVCAHHSGQIHGVLLDITMPEMNGEEVLRVLHAQYPGLPVVLMSGYSDGDLRERFPGNGYAAFLRKPFSLDTLRATVNAILAAK